jgi:hypothetical protein
MSMQYTEWLSYWLRILLCVSATYSRCIWMRSDDMYEGVFNFFAEIPASLATYAM